jgi:hypothetical protein
MSCGAVRSLRIGEVDRKNERVTADASKLEAKNTTLRWMDPVVSFKYPTIDGPKNPPVWPIQLMSPNAAAAVVFERKVVGIAQRLANAAVEKK